MKLTFGFDLTRHQSSNSRRSQIYSGAAGDEQWVPRQSPRQNTIQHKYSSSSAFVWNPTVFIMPTPNGTTTPGGATTPTLQTAFPRPSPMVKPLPGRKLWNTNEPHQVALFSFFLGIVFCGSLASAWHFSSMPQGWIYITFLSLFHFLEYYITAKYKADTVTIDGIALENINVAFLFNNGLNYIAAQGLGVAEFMVEWYFFPHTKILSQTTLAGTSHDNINAGLCLMVIGQLFRSLAMIHASSNFSHQISYQKLPTHQLVTSGVYSISRHPSYFGFFWWGVGTQIFLSNPLSTVVFIGVLWRFFSERIQYVFVSH
jgi:protein-S-isoprenylcysteine O-methyltransferase